MDRRQLGRSRLKVPAFSYGTDTAGGTGEFFGRCGRTEVTGADRPVDICLDAGVTMFDTADIYLAGASKEILGAALKGKRDRAQGDVRRKRRADVVGPVPPSLDSRARPA